MARISPSPSASSSADALPTPTDALLKAHIRELGYVVAQLKDVLQEIKALLESNRLHMPAPAPASSAPAPAQELQLELLDGTSTTVAAEEITDIDDSPSPAAPDLSASDRSRINRAVATIASELSYARQTVRRQLGERAGWLGVPFRPLAKLVGTVPLHSPEAMEFLASRHGGKLVYAILQQSPELTEELWARWKHGH